MSGFPGWGPAKGTKESTGLGEIEIPLLEGTNKILCSTRTQDRGAVTPQETEPDLHASVGQIFMPFISFSCVFLWLLVQWWVEVMRVDSLPVFGLRERHSVFHH